jgi:hypothetical protein
VAWTQTDVDRLKAAIASGTRSVAYADKVVQYQDITSMMTALTAMLAEVAGPASSGSRSTYAGFSRD